MPNYGLDGDDVVRLGREFAESLVRRDWVMAQSFLSPGYLDDDGRPVDLERKFDEMTSRWDGPAASVYVMSADPAWAIVAIDTNVWLPGRAREGVRLRFKLEDERPRITEIVWGRL